MVLWIELKKCFEASQKRIAINNSNNHKLVKFYNSERQIIDYRSYLLTDQTFIISIWKGVSGFEICHVFSNSIFSEQRSDFQKVDSLGALSKPKCKIKKKLSWTNFFYPLAKKFIYSPRWMLNDCKTKNFLYLLIIRNGSWLSLTMEI